MRASEVLLEWLAMPGKRPLLVTGVHVAGLWALAVVQPLLDVVAANWAGFIDVSDGSPVLGRVHRQSSRPMISTSTPVRRHRTGVFASADFAATSGWGRHDPLDPD
jgi:hypothetical protein